jgi:hypothetical protein
VIGFEDHVSTTTTVAAARSSLGPVLFTLESYAAFAAVPCSGVNFYFVNKHAFRVPTPNKKGEAENLAHAKMECVLVTRPSGFGDDVDATAVFIEPHFAIDQREKSPIATGPDVLTRDEFRSALPHKNAARGH